MFYHGTGGGVFTVWGARSLQAAEKVLSIRVETDSPGRGVCDYGNP